jgi:hypothetical protein
MLSLGGNCIISLFFSQTPGNIFVSHISTMIKLLLKSPCRGNYLIRRQSFTDTGQRVTDRNEIYGHSERLILTDTEYRHFPSLLPCRSLRLSVLGLFPFLHLVPSAGHL